MKYNKTSLNVPMDIWKQFKIKTIMEDKTATQAILDFINEYIKTPAKTQK